MSDDVRHAGLRVIVKTPGIVGGIAPESTVDYYRRIIAVCRERQPPCAYPPLVITSIDLDRMLALVQAGDLAELTDYLLSEVSRLAHAGADFALFASNTPHIVFDDIRRRSPIPLIRIVEAAGDAASTLDLKRVGLIGTRFTMQGSFYPNTLERHGIAVIAPGTAEQDYIHDRYMSELVRGVFLDDTRERIVAIARHLRETEHIDGLILGGTELPLLLRGALECEFQVLDTTDIHVRRAVDYMLG